jgi:hypothetical protein
MTKTFALLPLLALLGPTVAQAEAGSAALARGEAFAVAGILSHCGFYEDGLGCTVLADGRSYVASSYLSTEPDLLMAMFRLGLNVPVRVTGEMIRAEGTEALANFESFATEGTDPWATTRAALQGFWTSTEDPSYQVAILGSSFEEFSGEMPHGLEMMHFVEACADAAGEGPAFRLVSRDGSEQRCVFVTEVGADRLELFVAGTMRPLGFRRER